MGNITFRALLSLLLIKTSSAAPKLRRKPNLTSSSLPDGLTAGKSSSPNESAIDPSFIATTEYELLAKKKKKKKDKKKKDKKKKDKKKKDKKKDGKKNKKNKKNKKEEEKADACVSKENIKQLKMFWEESYKWVEDK